MSKSLSIAEYFQDRQIEAVFEGPLSDVEYVYTNSGDEGERPVAKSTGGATPIAPPSSTVGRGNRRAIIRRKKKRIAQQKDKKTDIKHVAKKRRLEALNNAIMVDYSLPSSVQAVTKPGWIGQRIADLPKRLFTFEELINDYKMTHFAWDGL